MFPPFLTPGKRCMLWEGPGLALAATGPPLCPPCWRRAEPSPEPLQAQVPSCSFPEPSDPWRGRPSSESCSYYQGGKFKDLNLDTHVCDMPHA